MSASLPNCQKDSRAYRLPGAAETEPAVSVPCTRPVLYSMAGETLKKQVLTPWGGTRNHLFVTPAFHSLARLMHMQACPGPAKPGRGELKQRLLRTVISELIWVSGQLWGWSRDNS